MIRLDTLPGDKGKRQKRKRVGRGHGSGQGKTSGRGHKGQMSRAGAKHRVGFEGGQMPIYRRLPKRGFTNYKFRVETEVVNLSALDSRFDEGQTITPDELAHARLISDPTVRVKILGEGELTKKLTVKAAAFSAKARQAIEARGGVCEAL